MKQKAQYHTLGIGGHPKLDTRTLLKDKPDEHDRMNTRNMLFNQEVKE